MRFFKRFAATLALMLGLTGGVVAVTASPALAVGDSCPALAVCVWENGDWTGASYYWTQPANGCTNLGGSWNDRAEAAKINWGSSSAYMTLYKDANCSGQVIGTATKQFASEKIINCDNTYNDNWNEWAFWCDNEQASSFFYHY